MATILNFPGFTRAMREEMQTASVSTLCDADLRAVQYQNAEDYHAMMQRIECQVTETKIRAMLINQVNEWHINTKGGTQ